MKTTFLIVLFLAMSWPAHAEEYVYIRSLKADLYASPAFSAEHLATFPKGTKLEKLKADGEWFLLQHLDVSGWVPRLLVSVSPPINRARGTVKEISETGQNARRRSSAVATAGAARGLASDDRHRTSQDNTTNYGALESMEARKIPDSEVVDFLEQGLAGKGNDKR